MIETLGQHPVKGLVLQVDDRERDISLIRHLHRLPGVRVVRTRLDTGDFLVAGQFVFERKTAADFARSLLDGRLFRQAARLARSPTRPAIILEGNAQEWVALGVPRHALQGALITLKLIYDLPVLRSQDAAETARLLLYAGSQWERLRTGGTAVYRRAKPKRHAVQQRRVLESLPGIGPQCFVGLGLSGCFLFLGPYPRPNMKHFPFVGLPLSIGLCAVAAESYYTTTMGELEWVESPPPLSQRVNLAAVNAFYLQVAPEQQAFAALTEADGSTNALNPRLDELSVAFVQRGELPIQGTLFLGGSPRNAMAPYPFRLPVGLSPTTSEKVRMVQSAHLRRLAMAGGPGSSWLFSLAGELAEAPTAANEDGAPAIPLPRRQSAQSALAFMIGGRAVAENLALDWVAPPVNNSTEEDKNTPVSEVRGITVPAVDWTPFLKDEPFEPEALVQRIPTDQPFLFFPSSIAALRAWTALEGNFPSALRLLPFNPADAGLVKRYEEQMALAPLRVFLGSTEESVALAVTAGDFAFGLGTDMAILIESAAVDELFQALQDEHASLAGQNQVSSLQESVGDAVVYVLESPDRRLSSYFSRLGPDTLIISNSLWQVRRLVGLGTGEEKTLGDMEEYRVFRQSLQPSAAEIAFLFLSDDTIRRWGGPAARIGALRRIEALASFYQSAYDQIAANPGAPPSFPTDHPYNNPRFLTPANELPVTHLTARELGLYEQWRRSYERLWSNAFDPIGLQIASGPDDFRIRLMVIPLTVRSQYRQFIDFTAGGKISPGDGDYSPRNLFHLVLALDPESDFFQLLRGQLSSMVPAAADPLTRWIGNSLSIYAESGSIWEQIMEAEVPQEVLRSFFLQAPIGLRMDSRSPVSLATFMALLRGFIDTSAPGLLRWSIREEGERSFVSVEAADPRMLGEDNFALHYATLSDSLALSLNEDFIRSRLRAKEGDSVDGPPPFQWPGEHVNLALNSEGLRLLNHLSHIDRVEARQRQSWAVLPLLNSLHQFYPEQNAVALYEAVYGQKPLCPGGGDYLWDSEKGVFYSSTFGYPAGAEFPKTLVLPLLEAVDRAIFGLTFTADGLAAEAVIHPLKSDE